MQSPGPVDIAASPLPACGERAAEGSKPAQQARVRGGDAEGAASAKGASSAPPPPPVPSLRSFATRRTSPRQRGEARSTPAKDSGELHHEPFADRDSAVHLGGEVHVVRRDEGREAGGADDRDAGSGRRGRRCADRGCRSARRRGAGAARSRPRARWRRAAARRPTVPPDDASRRSPRPRKDRSCAARSRASACDRPRMICGMHDVLEGRELRQQVVELVDEAELVAAQRRAAGIVHGGGRRGRRRRPRRRPASRAGRRRGGGSTCRCPTAPRGRRSRPARSRDRPRAGPRDRPRPGG